MDTESQTALLTAVREAAIDEAKAVAFFEARRWGDSPACPRCGSVAVYQMKDATTGTRNKDYRWRCKDCKRMYSVRTGTVFEETRLPMRVWAHAYWRACASKKGVSALQIKRETGITYQSALFLMHRVRWAMTDAPETRPKLTGTVEADETYVGGKPRNRLAGKRGRGTTKAPVFAVVQRKGAVRAWPIANITGKTLGAALRETVAPEARLITDEYPAYKKMGATFGGGHHQVKHRAFEYVRGDIHTNTIEGFFSLLKRKIYGTHHAVSREHLHRYVSEAAYLYSTRDMDDMARVAHAIKSAEGKRLLYRPSGEAAA